MDVVGHDDVAEDVEVVELAGSFEDGEEGVSGFRGSEDLTVTETGEDEGIRIGGGATQENEYTVESYA